MQTISTNSSNGMTAVSRELGSDIRETNSEAEAQTFKANSEGQTCSLLVKADVPHCNAWVQLSAPLSSPASC